MSTPIDAKTVKQWLSDGQELAFFDVQEAGQYVEGHPFFALPLPYSRLELDLPLLAPRRDVRMVLTDGGDGMARKAAARAAALGYGRVDVLAGGGPAWQAAGFTLFKGVNVPSKTFGELIEHAHHTPRITADELVALKRSGKPMLIVDGRTPAEYRRFNIPGGISVPNGELPLRIDELVRDTTTTIVVNCAGRTRSIIGAEMLRAAGVVNPIVALENGTQGWFLAGLQVEKGADRMMPAVTVGRDLSERRAVAAAFAGRHGVAMIEAGRLSAWLAEAERTTHVLDVRTSEEYAADGLAWVAHAPGGQLIQATDQWVGVRGARIVVLDDDAIRAPMVAGWLRRLGHEAAVLVGGIAAARAMLLPVTPKSYAATPLPSIDPAEAAAMMKQGSAVLLDLRASMEHRAGHPIGAIWSIRSRITEVVPKGKVAILLADDPALASLAALDLQDAGAAPPRLLAGGCVAWKAAGLAIEASPDRPADADCIDFMFFTHGRNEGDLDAARGYLSWEIGLVGQLDEQERQAFRI